jgi:hypothetical protein
MENSGPLVWYGVAVMIVCAGLILIPYLRGKSDLLTGWNVLLLGVGMWTGFGCLDVRYGIWYWPHLQWFQPSRDEVRWYMFVTTAFIVTLVLSYYYLPFGKRLASRSLQKWPPLNGPTYLLVLAICVTVVVASFVIPPTNFVGLVVYQLSHKALIFGCVFSFLLWYKDRMNVAWMLMFVGAFLLAALISMVVSGGRRMLLSVFLGPVLCVYWIHVRHWKTRNTLIALSLAASAILLVSVVYSSIRWFNRGPFKQERTAMTVIEQLRGLQHREGLFSNLFANRLNYFSQSNVHYALLTKRYVDSGQLIPVPLNTLRFIITYPIPRRIWPGKPQTLGVIVPHELAKIPSTTWGLGAAGHAAFEGGVFAMVIYGILVAVGIRFMDEPLRLQPTNPFLLSLHAAALPHVAGFARGDFTTMTLETAECFLFAILLSFVCRMVFGSERASVRSADVSAPIRGALPRGPQLRSPRLTR